MCLIILSDTMKRHVCGSKIHTKKNLSSWIECETNFYQMTGMERENVSN